MEFLFENLNFIHWLILGIALIILELFVWTVFLLWIGSSAITVGIIFFLLPNVSGLLQLLIFIVLAVVATLLSKKYYPVKTVDEQLHDKAKKHIGKECMIVSIEDEVAKVQIGESLWFAKGSNLSAGQSVKIIGVEAGGRGIDLGPDAHAAPLTAGSVGVLHGNRTYLMENEDGQIIEGHSISAGLDYPGVGPEHAYLKDIGRAEYVAITDKEALEAFHLLTEVEGIIPALEPSHAIAYAVKLAKQWSSDKTIIINLSGRGDKDMQTIAEVEGREL